MTPIIAFPLQIHLETLAELLDIPDDVYEDVVARYRELGQWLENQDVSIGRRPPEIYPQGSFRSGTIVRPVNDEDEFDIDLVYRRDLQKESTTQDQLKREAGQHLRRYVEKKQQQGNDAPKLEEGRRCWTLSYGARLHADVLPAIPDVEGGPESLLITDRDLRLWQHSNPIGYAEWFKGRMRQRLVKEREALAAALNKAVHEVPEWKVKTPLQRAVQLLKRHRDLSFRDDSEHKPASIILTTLAAHAYSDEIDIAETLVALVRKMPTYIQHRNGTYCIPNPLNPDENFADRWAESPERAQKFFKWLGQLRTDVGRLVGARNVDEAADLLKSMFGEMAANESLERVRTTGSPGSALVKSAPPLGDARHCLPPPWSVRLFRKATARGSVHKTKQATRLWALSSRPVPKEFWLRFEVDTNVSPPYEVHWQVVNTGREAQEARQLRGGFYAGEGAQGRIRWESTRYRGRHWVEAFIIKDGVCVARSDRVPVKIF